MDIPINLCNQIKFVVSLQYIGMPSKFKILIVLFIFIIKHPN